MTICIRIQTESLAECDEMMLMMMMMMMMMMPGGPRGKVEEAFESRGNICSKHLQHLTPGGSDIIT